MVVGPDSGKAIDLFVSAQLGFELFVVERCSVVAKVFLRHYSTVSAKVFIFVLRLEGLVRGHAQLVFDVDVSGGMIDEKASARVHLFGCCVSV